MNQNEIPEYAIGIDMGTNSIGWSVVEEKDGEPKELIDCGSRIFIRSVENDKPTPKNQKRRKSRLLRRVIGRRHRRKMRLRNYLISKGFLPQDLKGELNPEIKLNALGNPYEIRAKALDEPLTDYEFGRATLHLGTRRGFLSNRKTGFGDLRYDPDAKEILEIEDENAQSDDKDEGKFKEDIKKLRDEIENAGKRTLGEYLATLHRKRNRGDYHDRRTDRHMYQEEFEKIFAKQAELNPGRYTQDIKGEIEEIIFHQRPVWWDKNKIGKCSLEPQKSRIACGRLEFQQFRYWQDINNLNWTDLETGEIERKPTQEEKEKIAKALEDNKNLTWAALRKRLSLDKSTKFNLQKVEGKNRKGIKGNQTACGIREIIGEQWNLLGEDKQKDLVEDLISYKSKTGLKKRLQNHWQFDLERAIKLSVLELEKDHGNLSLKAIKKILPHLKQGKIYNPDAVEAAGYEEITVPKKQVLDTLGEIPFIPNPIVEKALYELRRVVNAIIKQYGKPTAVRIEMSRDLEMNTERYKKALEQQKKNTKTNEEADERYQEIRGKNPQLGLRQYISYNDKLKYRLWRESGQRCSYSGETICQTQLWSADVEIDHILPYSRSLDNSYMNKVVCLAEENRKKGNRTPLEAFGGTNQWNKIRRIAEGENYPKRKGKNILEGKIDDDFINSQLSDGRYIAKEAGKYIKTLGVDVTFTKGGVTSWLRHQWALNKILNDSDEKNRQDHRHHAIDATVIALTSRSLYQKIIHAVTRDAGVCRSPEHGLKVPKPFNNFRSEMEDAVNKIIISHATNRKITGAFHKDTAYGLRTKNGIKGTVVRKNLTVMTDKMVKNIICPVIKEGFEQYINLNGGLKEAKKRLKEQPFRHPKTGDIVRRARVLASSKTNEGLHFYRKNQEGKIIGVFTYGNHHHMEILKNKNNGKYEGIVVTAMEAARRAKIAKEPIVQTDHGEEWKFIMSLCINDMVSIEENGEKKFYRVRKINREKGGIKCPNLPLRIHTDSTPDKEFNKLPLNEKKKLEIAVAPSKLMTEYNMKKESINALGKILTSKN